MAADEVVRRVRLADGAPMPERDLSPPDPPDEPCQPEPRVLFRDEVALLRDHVRRHSHNWLREDEVADLIHTALEHQDSMQCAYAQRDDMSRYLVAWQEWAAGLLAKAGVQPPGGELGDGPARERITMLVRP